jgi:hypothetical protein
LNSKLIIKMAEQTDAMAVIREQFTRIKLLTSDMQIKDQTISILQEKLESTED